MWANLFFEVDELFGTLTDEKFVVLLLKVLDLQCHSDEYGESGRQDIHHEVSSCECAEKETMFGRLGRGGM